MSLDVSSRESAFDTQIVILMQSYIHRYHSYFRLPTGLHTSESQILQTDHHLADMGLRVQVLKRLHGLCKRENLVDDGARCFGVCVYQANHVLEPLTWSQQTVRPALEEEDAYCETEPMRMPRIVTPRPIARPKALSTDPGCISDISEGIQNLMKSTYLGATTDYVDVAAIFSGKHGAAEGTTTTNLYDYL